VGGGLSALVIATNDSAFADKAPRVATIRKGRIAVKENTRA
jgi:putative ABC transport system ATP-binding protein